MVNPEGPPTGPPHRPPMRPDGGVQDSDGSDTANVKLVITGAFTGIATLCILELVVLLILKFKKRTGLYFWSVVIATIGVTSINIGTILIFYDLREEPAWATTTCATLGVLLYVLPEYLVIYSRLHLLHASRRVLQFVLYLAITQYVLATVPAVGSWIAVRNYPRPITFKLGGIFSKILVLTYMAVEIIFSSIYIWYILKMWGKYPDPKTRQILIHFFCINSFLIGLHGGSVALGWTLGIAAALSNSMLVRYFI
jgi:hypothetical protein